MRLSKICYFFAFAVVFLSPVSSCLVGICVGFPFGFVFLWPSGPVFKIFMRICALQTTILIVK